MSKTLVVILSESRESKLTFDNFKQNVIDELNADLCLCIGVKNDYDYNNPFYQLAKYKFIYDEPDDFGDAFEYAYSILSKNKANYECLTSLTNTIIYKKPLYWREFLKVKDQFLGGIKDSHNQHPGSAGILIFFRWFLLKNLIEFNLINKYDRFIVTRSDFIYQLPHPKVELMNENCIWIPDSEHYGGYTDRHVVLSKNNIESYLNILNNLVLKSNDYFMKMKNEDNWNLEQLIKFHLKQNSVLQLVKEFPYIMYSVRSINGSTRWSQGSYSNELGYYIKYQSEYDKSSYYKNEFEKSALSITEFYSKCIKKNFNMLYFIPYNGNFGDQLNIYLIDKLIKILNLDIYINPINLATTQKYDKTLKTFSFLGSIMHLLPSNIDVIGTGVNPNNNNISPSLNIISLRGELSKNYLIDEKKYKIGNVILGDPALLIPRLFSEWVEPLPTRNNCEIGFIPHFNDIEHVNKHRDVFKKLNIEIYYPNQELLNVINFIRSKKTIISSSLHGIIVSEMLNKDVKWIMYNESLKSESELKYLEYFNSTGRINIKYVTEINQALTSTIPKPIYDDTELFNLIVNYFME